eukprot:gnl/Chilomastix_cuspidata/6109.p1 GENE.gnl/Chilomastix_cuspidata/6109~~gnl/Chilomastix_cuspidata/6109.p1  ORF type:complete len:417 (+),score=21.48 gnl/Chilomastix_cuspidata/6109:38-1288(+)
MFLSTIVDPRQRSKYLVLASSKASEALNIGMLSKVLQGAVSSMFGSSYGILCIPQQVEKRSQSYLIVTTCEVHSYILCVAANITCGPGTLSTRKSLLVANSLLFANTLTLLYGSEATMCATLRVNTARVQQDLTEFCRTLEPIKLFNLSRPQELCGVFPHLALTSDDPPSPQTMRFLSELHPRNPLPGTPPGSIPCIPVATELSVGSRVFAFVGDSAIRASLRQIREIRGIGDVSDMVRVDCYIPIALPSRTGEEAILFPLGAAASVDGPRPPLTFLPACVLFGQGPDGQRGFHAVAATGVAYGPIDPTSSAIFRAALLSQEVVPTTASTRLKDGVGYINLARGAFVTQKPSLDVASLCLVVETIEIPGDVSVIRSETLKNGDLFTVVRFGDHLAFKCDSQSHGPTDLWELIYSMQ